MLKVFGVSILYRFSLATWLRGNVSLMGFVLVKAAWAGDKCGGSKDLWESHRSLWRGRHDGALVPFNSATGLKFAGVSKIENCQEPFYFFIFFFFPLHFSPLDGWNKWGLSANTHVQLSPSRQLSLLPLVSPGGWGVCRLWQRAVSSSAGSSNCPFSPWPGWDREVSWKSRTGSPLLGCAPAQAVAILVSVNTLTSQFPECLCHLFMPAFYLYS